MARIAFGTPHVDQPHVVGVAAERAGTAWRIGVVFDEDAARVGIAAVQKEQGRDGRYLVRAMEEMACGGGAVTGRVHHVAVEIRQRTGCASTDLITNRPQLLGNSFMATLTQGIPRLARVDEVRETGRLEAGGEIDPLHQTNFHLRLVPVLPHEFTAEELEAALEAEGLPLAALSLAVFEG